MKPVWIVDDDRSIRWVLEKTLSREGIPFKSYASASEAISQLEQGVEPPQVLMSDIRMPGQSGLELLQEVKTRFPSVPVIIMTAYSDLESAVAAFQGGAFEYLPKPFDVDQAVELIRRAVDESMHQSGAKEEEGLVPEILGQAPAMQEVFRAIGRLALSHATVMITGESGSGKELVARALHRHSPRSDKPFIAINTAAIPKDLLESELFGHERGAFTGAQSQRRGRFEQAESGTLFLDEIGDMPSELQTRLARAVRWPFLPGWRPFADQGQRPRHRGDAPEPGEPGQGRAVPRGSFPSPERHPRSPAVAARATRGHSLAHPPLPAEERPRTGRRGQAPFRSSAQVPAGTRISGQCPAAGKPLSLADRHGARAAGGDR
jgi:FixJ family two-component response regulator